jgi:phosphomannomutase|tara:strand:- start:458 stop:1222 length:765 start_codon:yes stop_codon:yes gene_type:complete
MTAKFLFDVDGVLCDRGQPINDQFRWWLEDFLLDKEYYLVTGSPRNKTIGQIGERLTIGSKIGFHCLGNSIWTENGFEVVINKFTFSKNELAYLKGFYERSIYNAKQPWEDVLEDRPGSVNFSFVKRGADLEHRQSFIEYDNLYKERENFVRQLNDTHPRFDCYLGGDCSIDIVLRGANKGQIFSWDFNPLEQHYFFGDRCEQYGIDKPLHDCILASVPPRESDEPPSDGYSHSFVIKEGYKETWEILKSLKTE